MLKRAMVILCVALAQPAWSWDQEPLVERPPILGRVPASIKEVSVRLETSGSKVVEYYELLNGNAQHQQFTLSMVTSPYRRTGMLDEYPDKDFSELTIGPASSVREGPTQRVFLYEGRDVTAYLASIGVDGLRAVHDDKYRAGWPEALVHKLAARGLIAADDASALPRWSVVTARSWKVHVKPGERVGLSVSYLARPSLDALGPEDVLSQKRLGAQCAGLADRSGEQLILRTYRLPVGVGDLPVQRVDFQRTFPGSGDSASSARMSVASCHRGLVSPSIAAGQELRGQLEPLSGAVEFVEYRSMR